ncbi:hypothetical protein AO377_1803 [Moraxella catarrhalis]|nr:hypothetical protein AO381_0249 [Moraxella catarrhalis]OAV08605.1 hypothetical protein AO377_1803 [Moraxella catarrhalis]OAV14170.1 hypothetical protein AO375_1285 [Moraxella catarrhalis]OAV14552.1 hypothetical protein AO376_1142 [Moraxella catarrhalis]OAV16340.1 hypothetical protein AO374_1827 [Moraxella catarrhalis]
MLFGSCIENGVKNGKILFYQKFIRIKMVFLLIWLISEHV